MSDQKQRVEIPPDTAAEVLFLADRTCCVCRQRGKPVQIHHIDGDSSNSVGDNLAVLCFDCHRETQIRGGFDRKLDAAQVRLYKEDWNNRVEQKRGEEGCSTRLESAGGDQTLRYFQVKEKSDEHLYDFEADFVLVGSADTAADMETNLAINGFVTKQLQRFRIGAISSTPEKNEMKKNAWATCWDSFAMSHSVSLFTAEILSLEFQVFTYGAGAAHPNHRTETLNFRLHPSMQLELSDIFKARSGYLNLLSDYCVDDLHKQQPQRWGDPVARVDQLKQGQDEWILRGAGPEYRNYERLSLGKNGIVIHFDQYQVGSYAEGKYEVSIPAYQLKPIIQDDIAALLGWN
jgi:hypothetical protein